MTPDRDNLVPYVLRREPLPVEFECELSDVDALLDRGLHADAGAMPEGLSQRVFEMSVQSLPAPMRLVGAADSPVSASRYSFAAWAGWARLALAAAVLLGAGVALWVSQRPPVTPVKVATNNGGAGTGGGETATVAFVPDLSDLDQLADRNPSDLAAFERNWSYLLDASEVRSVNDLNADVAMLVAQLEM